MAGAWRHRRPDPSHLHGSKVRFAPDSSLEGAGFEPSVPRLTELGFPPGNLFRERVTAKVSSIALQPVLSSPMPRFRQPPRLLTAPRPE
jgi:hypothetical protein